MIMNSFYADDGRHNPKFINFRKDEILYTDGRVLEISGGSAGGESNNTIDSFARTHRWFHLGRLASRKIKVYQAVNEHQWSGCKSTLPT
jgi:hypothetical protein